MGACYFVDLVQRVVRDDVTCHDVAVFLAIDLQNSVVKRFGISNE